MTDTTDRMPMQIPALECLRAFGLEQLLTADDDPELWAAVLARFWKPVDDPGLWVESLKFGVGYNEPYDPDSPVAQDRSGLQRVEVWCFERVDPFHLKLVECRPAPVYLGSTLMAGMAGFGSPSTPAAPGATDYIAVSRPSAGVDDAAVHHGISFAPVGGEGQTHVWRKSSGVWRETDEILSRWIS